MDKKKFVKLKDLINSSFTVLAVPKYSYKLWDNAEKRMIVRDTYEKDFRKLYQVETDKGTLDMGSGQLGNLLEAVFKQGKADLINRTFEVKSNGKEGMDIRYFFNAHDGIVISADSVSPSSDLPPVDVYDNQIDVSEIPF